MKKIGNFTITETANGDFMIWSDSKPKRLNCLLVPKEVVIEFIEKSYEEVDNYMKQFMTDKEA